jgi:hypothetical protein
MVLFRAKGSLLFRYGFKLRPAFNDDDSARNLNDTITLPNAYALIDTFSRAANHVCEFSLAQRDVSFALRHGGIASNA